MSNYTKYLEAAITRWYTNAKMDYNVNGRFISAQVYGDAMSIIWEEEGQKFKTSYRWYTDFTPRSNFQHVDGGGRGEHRGSSLTHISPT